MKKIDWASFFSNILAVVLGIFITFGIQGLVDRKSERKDVISAMELVKEELQSNKESLQQASGIIISERHAAEFIKANRGSLARCDADSVKINSAFLCNEMFLTVTNDALELLKSSSLFQKMNDNALALSIIKAYDYLDANAKAFNLHEKYKMGLVSNANTVEARKASLSNTETDYLEKFYASEESEYFLKSIIEMSSVNFLKEGMAMLDEAIAEIDKKLK